MFSHLCVLVLTVEEGYVTSGSAQRREEEEEEEQGGKPSPPPTSPAANNPPSPTLDIKQAADKVVDDCVAV